MKIKAGLLDLDGTLAQLEIDHLISEYKRITLSLGIEPADETHVRQCLASGSLKHAVDEKLCPEFENLFWDNFDELSVPALNLFPWTIEALTNLVEKGVKLALVTARNVNQEQIVSVLKEADIYNYFSVVYSKQYVVGPWEGKHVPFIGALKALAVEPQYSFAVGDRPSDAISAKKIGVGLNILVRSGGTREDLLQNTPADHVQNDFSHSAEMILSSL